MEVYRPIQAIPQGLLGFLQLKNAGKNPQELNSLLQSSLDLGEWMLQTAPEIEAGTNGAIAAAGFTAYQTVPDGEWWFLHDVNATLGLAAAATAVAVPAFRQGSTSLFSAPNLLARNDTVWSQATHGSSLIVPADLRRPRFIGPGFQIGIYVSALSAPTTAITNTVTRFTRLIA